MSEAAERRTSVSSVSLMEIKAETHLVLQAFLQRTLDTPHKDRPGRVGGAYDDHTKFSFKPKPRSKNGLDQPSNDEESKKPVFKGLKKLSKRNTFRRNKDPKDSLESPGKAAQCEQKEDVKPSSSCSSSSSSDEEDDAKKRWSKKQKKIKRKLSKLFKKRNSQKKEKEKENNSRAESSRDTPSHPPDYYDNLAEKLDELIRTKTQPLIPIVHNKPVCDKEAVIQNLVQLLSQEGDAINTKIQADPILCSNLKRLSYGSFERVLNIFNSSQESQISASAPPASPTLHRMVVSMEVSRRMVMATGTHRIQGFAEHYMNTFTPWVKSHGGWENVVELGEQAEFD